MERMQKSYLRIFLISSLLLLSWLLPFTRRIWDVIDEKAYFALNSLLAFKPLAIVIGILSQHITDFLFDVLMGVLFIWMLKKVKPGKVIPFLVATFLVELGSFYYVNKKLIANYLAYDRLSPSLVMQGGINILHQIPFGGVKVTAHHCFPGDHATTFFLWAFFMWVFGGKKFGKIALGLATFFCMPRIIVGAHWLTDVFIGGLSVAALLLVLAMSSKLVEGLAVGLVWVQQKLKERVQAKSKKEDSPPLK